MEDKTKIAVKPVGSQYHLKRDTKLSVDSNDKLKIFSLKQQIKFIDSEKATKFCKISTVVPVKSTVEISQNFVAFSEYMNVTLYRL